MVSGQRWEYLEEVTKVVELPLEALNKLGEEGWELVAVWHEEEASGRLRYTHVFKRPKVEKV